MAESIMPEPEATAAEAREGSDELRHSIFCSCDLAPLQTLSVSPSCAPFSTVAPGLWYMSGKCECSQQPTTAGRRFCLDLAHSCCIFPVHHMVAHRLFQCLWVPKDGSETPSPAVGLFYWEAPLPKSLSCGLVGNFSRNRAKTPVYSRQPSPGWPVLCQDKDEAG